jgi:hypothetical protein
MKWILLKNSFILHSTFIEIGSFSIFSKV